MSLNSFKYSIEKNTLKREYLVPTRVVTQKGAENAEHLLLDSPRQAVIVRNEGCLLKEGHMLSLTSEASFAAA